MASVRAAIVAAFSGPLVSPRSSKGSPEEIVRKYISVVAASMMKNEMTDRLAMK